MVLKRNLVTIIVIVIIFCFGIFILYGQLGDDKEKIVMYQAAKELVNEQFKLTNHTEENDELNGPDVKQDDPRLIAKLLKNYIINSTIQALPYYLDDYDLDDTSMGQSKKILKLLDYKKNGFFVECGALDGETRSNTLVFERTYDWSGLLIEADPSNFAKMVKKNRKAYLSPTCLSIKPYPMKATEGREGRTTLGKIHDRVLADCDLEEGYLPPGSASDIIRERQVQETKSFSDTIGIQKVCVAKSYYYTSRFTTPCHLKQAVNVGKISEFPVGHREDGYVDVQCFPLYTYLLALNRTTVDYFSLDVEGNELDVLKTIPFDKVDIQTLSVEFVHVKVGEEDGKAYLREFMESKGYEVDSEVIHENNLANDFIFINEN